MNKEQQLLYDTIKKALRDIFTQGATAASVRGIYIYYGVGKRAGQPHVNVEAKQMLYADRWGGE